LFKRWIVLLLSAGVLSACAVVPNGPSVMVLPGAGKPFDQFQVDDAVCRQYAQQQTGIPPGQAATESTVNSAALGTVLGAAAGAAIGAAAGDAGLGAAVGAGSGLLFGTASGAQAGAVSSGALQWRYDVAYMQCMYAKGNQMPGVASAPRPAYVPPPPPGTPPPPSSAPPPPPPRQPAR
jgi:Glycine-zipper domain